MVLPNRQIARSFFGFAVPGLSSGRSAGFVSRFTQSLAGAVLLVLLTLFAVVANAADLYWDTNGTGSNAGTTAGTWGSSAFWVTDSTGSDANLDGTAITTASDNLYFSAGTTDTGGTNPQVTVSGTQSAANILFNYRTNLRDVGFRITGGTTINLNGGINVQANPNNVISALYEDKIETAISLAAASTIQNNSPLTLSTTGAITTGGLDLTLNNNSVNDFGVNIRGGIVMSGSGKIINQGTGVGIVLINTGGISGTAGGVVQDSATSALDLQGANSFVGNIELKQGVLIIGTVNNNTDVNGLGNANNQILFNGGVLAYGTRTNQSIDISSRFSASSTGDYKIDIPASTSIYTTALSRTGVGLHKYGQGGLTLTAAALYTGDTIIGGVDVANRQMSGGGALTIGNGTTGSLNGTTGTKLEFKGTGTFNVAEAGGSTQAMKETTFTSGDGTVQSTFAATSADLTLLSVTRASGGTGNFVVSGGTAGTSALNANGTLGTNNIKITGHSTGQMGGAYYFGGANYAYYDVAGFVRALDYVNDVTPAGAATGAGGTSVASATHQELTGAVSAQASAAFTTLKLKNTANALQEFKQMSGSTVTSNNVLVSGGTGTASLVTISGGTAFSPTSNAELVIRTDVANDRLIIRNLARNGTNALTKSGAGSLVLAGANTLGGNGITGNLTINQGATLVCPSADTTYTGQVSGQGRLDVMGKAGSVILAPTTPLLHTGGMVLNGTVVLDYTNMTDPTNMIFTGIPGAKGTGNGSGFVQFGGGTGNVARTAQQGGTLIIKGKTGANVSTYQQLGATGLNGSGTNVSVINGMAKILVNPNGGADTTVVLGFMGTAAGTAFMLGKAADAGSGNVYFISDGPSNLVATSGDFGRFYYTSDGGTTVDHITRSSELTNGQSLLVAKGTFGTTAYATMTTNGGDYLTGTNPNFVGNTLTRIAGLAAFKVHDMQDGQILNMGGQNFSGYGGLIMTGSGTGTFTITNGGTTTAAGTGNHWSVGQFALNQDLVYGVSFATGGAHAFEKNGGGRMILQNTVANTYSSGTFLNEGILQVNVSNTLTPFGTSGNIRFSGGTLQYSANNQFDYSNRFNTTGNEPISIDTNGQTVTFATAIQGNATELTKSGAGQLNLTAAGTFTGATTVKGGTLKLDTAGSLDNSLIITVGDSTSSSAILDVATKTGGFTLGGTTAQTLNGKGTVTGNVTVGAFGTLSPGNSIESLDITGDLGFNTGSLFDYELKTAVLDGDLMNITGNLNIASGVSLGLMDLGTSTSLALEKLTLISYSGTWNSGTFAGYLDDTSFTLGANSWTINYNDTVAGSNLLGGGAGSSYVTITTAVVPEPGTLVLLFTGLAFAGFSWRKRLASSRN